MRRVCVRERKREEGGVSEARGLCPPLLCVQRVEVEQRKKRSFGRAGPRRFPLVQPRHAPTRHSRGHWTMPWRVGEAAATATAAAAAQAARRRAGKRRRGIFFHGRWGVRRAGVIAADSLVLAKKNTFLTRTHAQPCPASPWPSPSWPWGVLRWVVWACCLCPAAWTRAVRRRARASAGRGRAPAIAPQQETRSA
jgi:hypothetical protein